MTNEHDSASVAATSLLANGEVCGARALQYLRYITDAQSMHTGVVGDSMSEKEGTRKSGRPAWIDRWNQRRAGFRAIIVVKKRGNSRGAKGGRKAKADERERCHTVGTRLPDRARTPEAKSPHLNWKLLADVTERQASGGESASPYTATSVLTMRQLADWRAVCGRSARPVRREGRRNPMRRSYPYLAFAVSRHCDCSKHPSRNVQTVGAG